jgi:hypothetical protein
VSATVVLFSLAHNSQRYYEFLGQYYEKKREFMLQALEAAGLPCIKPQGSFFIMADTSKLNFPNSPPAGVQEFVASGKLQVFFVIFLFALAPFVTLTFCMLQRLMRRRKRAGTTILRGGCRCTRG